MKKIWFRISLLVIPLLLAFALFECTLRVFYWGDYFWRQSHSHKKNLGHKILCIGNSFTMGAGAPPGESYPDHLQRLLDQDIFFNHQVINLGRGAFNTTLILENLHTWLVQYRPQYVLLQVGEPNYWNLYGYDQFKGEKEFRLKNFIINHSAVIRFFAFVKAMNTPPLPSNSDFIWSQSDSIKESPYWNEFNSLKEFTLSCLIAEGKIDLRSKLLNSPHFKKMPEHLKRAQQIYSLFPNSPSAIRLMYELEASCNLNVSKAIPYLHQLIEIEPRKKLNLLNDTWRTLNSFAYSDEMRRNDKESFINYLNDRHPAYKNVVTKNNTPRYRDWILADLKKMIFLIKREGAVPIILNYPPTVKNTPREIDELLRSFARNENLAFIDIEKHFNELWKQNKLQKKDLHEVRLGIPLDHLNGSGYKIVAEEVFKEMNLLKAF